MDEIHLVLLRTSIDFAFNLKQTLLFNAFNKSWGLCALREPASLIMVQNSDHVQYEAQKLPDLMLRGWLRKVYSQGSSSRRGLMLHLAQNNHQSMEKSLSRGINIV